MAGQTRIFGLGVTAGTLYSHGANGFKLTVQNASNANIDLRAEDDAVDEAVEEIIGELNPLMYFVVNDNSGIIHIAKHKISIKLSFLVFADPILLLERQ